MGTEIELLCNPQKLTQRYILVKKRWLVTYKSPFFYNFVCQLAVEVFGRPGGLAWLHVQVAYQNYNVSRTNSLI